MATRDELPPPPRPIPIVRSIQCSLWESGISLFDGINPIFVHSTRKGTEYWSFHIELHEEKPMCVTRLNGVIKDMFAATAPK